MHHSSSREHCAGMVVCHINNRCTLNFSSLSEESAACCPCAAHKCAHVAGRGTCCLLRKMPQGCIRTVRTGSHSLAETVVGAWFVSKKATQEWWLSLYPLSPKVHRAPYNTRSSRARAKCGLPPGTNSSPPRLACHIEQHLHCLLGEAVNETRRLK